MGFPKIDFEVQAYPISPVLTANLPPANSKIKFAQLDPEKNHTINLSIPISGAAVGLNFFNHIVDKLNHISPRFAFKIIVKSSNYTKNFIQKMLNIKNVELITSDKDREIVEKYEVVYKIN